MANTSLTDLNAFATVARLRSFRKASLELGVSPSALSHTLRNLETRLGLRLLNRTTRSVAPTEAGERLLARLAPALLEVEDALDALNDFRESPQGTLRINAPHTAVDFVLAPLITRFLARHPGMRVDLQTDNAMTDIVAAGFDAGVRFGERVQQDMVAVPIGPSQRLIAVASPAYLAAHGTPRHPRELKTHACIQIRFANGRLYPWEFARGKTHLEVEVSGPLAVSAGEAGLMLQAAEAHLGIAFVFDHDATDALASGKLVPVLDAWCPRFPGYFLYYPSRKLMPAGLKAFVAMLQED